MNRGWSQNTVIKYVLLQIPMTVLIGVILFWIRNSTGLSVWIICTILGIWIAKDGILFFFVWPAYEDQPQNDKLSMIGRLGIAREDLAPSGYIRVNGTLWKARLSENAAGYVEQGSEVRILGRDGLTLEVAPEKQNHT